MNKYKVNLIYNEKGLNLNEIIIKTLIKEIKIIYNKDYYKLLNLNKKLFNKTGIKD